MVFIPFDSGKGVELSKSGPDVHQAGMNAGVSCPIDGRDPKHGLARSGRPKRAPLKLTLRSGVFQGELPGNLAAVTPLPPNFEFVRIPETSGSKRTPSEHLHFRPDLNFFSFF